MNNATQVLTFDSSPFDFYFSQLNLVSTSYETSVLQTTINPLVASCYDIDPCYPFPVTWEIFQPDATEAIQFTPKREACGTTQLFGYMSSVTYTVMYVTLIYQPFACMCSF